MSLFRRFVQLACIYVLGFLANACNHAYYAPDLPLAPVFEKRGDWMLSGGLAGQLQSYAGVAKVGYAFSNHFFAAGEWSSTKGKNIEKNEGQGRSLGVVGGWYKMSGAKSNGRWLYTLPFSVHVGRTTNTYYSRDFLVGVTPYFNGSTVHRMRKAAFEPGVAFLGKRFHFHSSLRMGTLRYYELQNALGVSISQWKESFPTLFLLYPVVEPCFALSYGGPNWRAQLKWVYVVPRYTFASIDRNFGVSFVLYPRDFP